MSAGFAFGVPSGKRLGPFAKRPEVGYRLAGPKKAGSKPGSWGIRREAGSANASSVPAGPAAGRPLE